MKRSIIILAVVFTLAGCGTALKTTTLNITGNTVTYRTSGFSMVSSGDEAKVLAGAVIAYKDVERKTKIDELYRNEQRGAVTTGTTPTAGKYYLAVKNNANQPIYFYHPEISTDQRWVKPKGDVEKFKVQDIPKRIDIYNVKGDIIKIFEPRYDPYLAENMSHKKLIDGVEIDLLFTVTRAQ